MKSTTRLTGACAEAHQRGVLDKRTFLVERAHRHLTDDLAEVIFHLAVCLRGLIENPGNDVVRLNQAVGYTEAMQILLYKARQDGNPKEVEALILAVMGDQTIAEERVLRQ